MLGLGGGGESISRGTLVSFTHGDVISLVALFLKLHSQSVITYLSSRHVKKILGYPQRNQNRGRF